MPEPLSEERLAEIRARQRKALYEWNEADAARCTTHSFACDCREWQHRQDIAALLAEVDRLRAEVAKEKQRGVDLAAIVRRQGVDALGPVRVPLVDLPAAAWLGKDAEVGE
jgi:hypothetical protein